MGVKLAVGVGYLFNLTIPTMLGSPRPPLGLVLHWEDSQDSACSCTHSFDLLQCKDTKISERKRLPEQQSPGETQAQTPQAFSQWDHTGCANSSNSDLWQFVRSIYPGSSLETQLLLGAGHIGSLCLACNKIPDSQQGSRCSAETILFAQTA